MRGRLRGRARQGSTPYKLLSLLLQYPDERILAAEEEITRAVAELPPSPEKEALDRFCRWWCGRSGVERGQHYVATFDLQKQSALHLTFYGDGDRRQRGGTLLRLKRLYEAGGMVLHGGELPDFLPVVLEFAAFAPSGYGKTVLLELRPAIEVLRARLHDLDSPYALLLDAVSTGLPALTRPELDTVRRLIAEGPPREQVGLEPFAPPEVMPVTGARR